MKSSKTTTRAKTAKESFQMASECIGTISPGMSLFAITRGQWAMVDAILHCLDQTGPAHISLWTWTIAEYEVQTMTRLRIDQRLLSARLVIDGGGRVFHDDQRTPIISQWRQTFGDDSIRYVSNHAKIARIWTPDGRLKLLLRGSMNLNMNPRFEQFDISEGGPAFDLVTEIEDDLPVLPATSSRIEQFAASKCGAAFGAQQLQMFAGAKVWGK